MLGRPKGSAGTERTFVYSPCSRSKCLEHHSKCHRDVVDGGVWHLLRAVHIVVSSLYERANTGVGEREGNAGTPVRTEVIFALRNAWQTKRIPASAAYEIRLYIANPERHYEIRRQGAYVDVRNARARDSLAVEAGVRIVYPHA